MRVKRQIVVNRMHLNILLERTASSGPFHRQAIILNQIGGRDITIDMAEDVAGKFGTDNGGPEELKCFRACKRKAISRDRNVFVQWSFRGTKKSWMRDVLKKVVNSEIS